MCRRGRTRVVVGLAGVLLATVLVGPRGAAAAPGPSRWLHASPAAVQGQGVALHGQIDPGLAGPVPAALVADAGTARVDLGRAAVEPDGTVAHRGGIPADLPPGWYWAELATGSDVLRSSRAVLVRPHSLLDMRVEPAAATPGADIRIWGGPFVHPNPFAHGILLDEHGLERITTIGTLQLTQERTFDGVLRIPPATPPGRYQLLLESPSSPETSYPNPESPRPLPVVDGPVTGGSDGSGSTGGEGPPPPAGPAPLAAGEPASESESESESRTLAVAPPPPGPGPGDPGLPGPVGSNETKRSRALPITVLPPPAATLAPPAVAQRGTAMDIRFTGVAPGTQVRLEAVRDRQTEVVVPLGTAAVGQDGLARSAHVPAGARQGLHWLRALATDGRLLAAGAFTWLEVPRAAAIEANPRVVAQGGVVMVSGHGVNAEELTLDLADERGEGGIVRTFGALDEGRFAQPFVIPAWLPPGRYRFRSGELMTPHAIEVVTGSGFSTTHDPTVPQGGRLRFQATGMPQPSPEQQGPDPTPLEVTLTLVHPDEPLRTLVDLRGPTSPASPGAPQGRGLFVREDGTVDADVTVPGTVPPGRYALRVRAGDLDHLMPPNLLVQPGRQWSLDPVTVAQGDLATFRGSGLGPLLEPGEVEVDLVDLTGQRVVAELGQEGRQQPRQALQLTEDGELSGRLRLPGFVAPGTYRLVLNTGADTALTTTGPIMTVTPGRPWQARLDRRSVPQGATIGLQLDGVEQALHLGARLESVASPTSPPQSWPVVPGPNQLRVSGALPPGPYQLHLFAHELGAAGVWRLADVEVTVGRAVHVDVATPSVVQGGQLTIDVAGVDPRVREAYVSLVQDGRNTGLGVVQLTDGRFHGDLRVPLSAPVGRHRLSISPRQADLPFTGAAVEVTAGPQPVVRFGPAQVPQGGEVSVAVEGIEIEPPLPPYTSVVVVDDSTGAVVRSEAFRVDGGRASGAIAIPGTVPPGRYRIVAAGVVAGTFEVTGSDRGFRLTSSPAAARPGEVVHVEATGLPLDDQWSQIDVVDAADGSHIEHLALVRLDRGAFSVDVPLPPNLPYGEVHLRVREVGVEKVSSPLTVLPPPPPPPDHRPPTVTVAATSEAGRDGWFRQVPVIAIDGDDAGGSGVDGFRFSATGGLTLPEVDLVVDRARTPIPFDGVTTVTARAVDRRRNQSQPASTTVKVDRVPPTITVSTPPAINGGTGVVPVGTALRFAAADATSGVHHLDATLRDWDWQARAVEDGHVLDRTGVYQLLLFAEDVAGNPRRVETTIVVVDGNHSVAGNGRFSSNEFDLNEHHLDRDLVEVKLNVHNRAGTIVPTGEVHLSFENGSSLRVTELDWLVARDGRAHLVGRFRQGREVGRVILAVQRGTERHPGRIRLRVEVGDEVRDTYWDERAGLPPNLALDRGSFGTGPHRAP